MDQAQLAELSRLLYSPVTLLLYVGAAFVYFYSLTTRVGRREDEVVRGRRAQLLGLGLASLGVLAHVAHEVTRGLAQERLPLGNMFEFSSLMALAGVLTGLIYLHVVRRRPELSGFVMLAGALVLASAMLVYAEPGPLMPILDTWWRHLHVSLIVTAAGILTAGFVFNALHLLRDTADGRVDERERAAASGGTHPGGAPATTAVLDGPPAGDIDDAVGERVAPDEDVDDGVADGADRRTALRRAIPVGRLAVGTFLGASTVSWAFVATPTLDLATGVTRFLTINLVLVGAALVGRWLVPYLPPAATLDGLAYRTIALGFVAWTVGVITGAMWAEQSWGRFWGWDPKETASFVVWVVYAAYLHARATRGTRGRGAAWIGILGFIVLMLNYYAVNLVFVGLHSYAGL